MAHSYIKLPLRPLVIICGAWSYGKLQCLIRQASMFNYHISSGGKASAGNCVQGHTRDSQVSWPRDALQIRSGQEQGEGKELSCHPCCRAWRELPDHGTLQPPTSRDSRQICKHSHNTCIHTNTREYQGTTFPFWNMSHQASCGHLSPIPCAVGCRSEHTTDFLP